MVEHIQLMILSGWNPLKPGGAGMDTRYFGTKGFVSKPTDTPANTYFAPYITNPGMFSQSMYSVGSTGGASSGGFGVVELLNNDGSLDYLIDWGFDGFICTILDVPLDGDFADASTIITGTIEQVEHSWLSISFRFKDNTMILDKPVALHYYAGTNALPAGLEGVDDLKGKPKPRLFGNGVAFNIEPVLVNTAKLTYQCNDGAITSIGAVRDNGVVLTVGTAHANSTALQAATVAAGTYDTCLSEGYIRLGSSPAGQVTIDVTASALSVGQTIKALAVEKLGATGVVEQSIIDLDAAIPATVLYQYYTGPNDVTTKAVLDSLSQMGIWWGFDNRGKFWAKQFAAPTSYNPIATIDKNRMFEIERTATNDTDKGVPVWRVICRYKRNNTVQNTLAGSVALGIYDKEWLEAVYEDISIKAVHPLAAEITIDTAFTTYTDALAEATRQFNLRSVRRDRLRVTLPVADGPLVYPIGGYWEDEAISEMPTNRYYHGAVVFGNYLYVLGGYNGSAVTTSVIRLDLSNPTGAWDDSGVTDLPAARYRFNAAIHGNYVYVVGGVDGSSNVLASVIRLDLSTPNGAWDDAGVTDLPTGRHGHGLLVHNDYLYVFGGETTLSASGLTSVIRLDLNNPAGAWDDAGVTDLPAKRTGMGAVLHGDYAYIAGGIPEKTYAAMTSVIRLDLSSPTGAWDDAGVADLPAARAYFGSALQDGFLYAAGGFNLTIANVQTTVYRMDLDSPAGNWETLTPYLDKRSYQQLASVEHALYSIGGWIGSGTGVANTWRFRNNDNPDDLAELRGLGRTVLVDISRYGYATTFSRASTATYIDSDGLLKTAAIDVPRYDFTNGVNNGLLIEAAATNYCPYSQSFQSTGWQVQAGASRLDNQDTAPDGTLTAATVILATTGDSALFRSGMPSGTITVSVWVKGAYKFRLARYNATDGTTYSANFQGTANWQRFSYTFVNAAASYVYFIRESTATGGTFSVWGFQVEMGPAATSYIPTTTAAVTRAADVVTETGGRPMKIIGVESNYRDRHLTLDLWG